MAAVLPLGANDLLNGSISAPGEVDEFQITIPDNGRFTATVTGTASALDTRLSLLGPDGQVLIHSDALSLTNHDDKIVQHVLGGTYLLQVAGLGNGTGTYTLMTRFEPANPPNLPLVSDFGRDFPFALSPFFATTGDFNRDGIPDLATSNDITNDVTVRLGLGDGTFGGVSNFAVGNTPFGVVAGDFDGDHILDLAAANQNADPAVPAGPGTAPYAYDVSVLRGNGDGTFQPEIRIPAGNRTYGLFMADLNGDGHLDLILANQGTNDVSILLGNGNATFQPEVRYATGDAPNYVSVGDFNQDGHPDLAVENYFSNTVSILINKGDGTFAKISDLTGGGIGVSGVAAGDFNGDGRLDLAAANSGSYTADVFLGNGDGTFQRPASYAVGASAFVVVTRDLNHDGRLDLAVANRQSNDVSVLLGRGDGTFQHETRYRAGLQPLALIVADFNGDGTLDLATANGRSHDVSILLGLGDGTFQDDLTDPRRGETNPLGTVVRDFNGDGIGDLAVVSYTGHNVFILLGRGDGTFGPRVSYEVGSTPVSLVAADVNGDGKLDLVTANCDSADLSVLLGNGDGTFRNQTRFRASASGEFMVGGDFNGDGRLDLIDSGEFSFGVSLILGNGDGTFQTPRRFGVEDTPSGGAVGDFNRDGKLDLAVTNFFSPDHHISVFLGNGDGTFQDEKVYGVGELPFGIVAGDFNGDGKLDLVTTNEGSQSVSLLLGRGDGTFADEVRFATGPVPDSLFAADFNADGWLDLAVSNAGDTDVSVLLGRGNGTFQDHMRFAVGDGSTPRTGFSVADLNDDGWLDIVASQLLGNNVAILLGRGDGTFQAPRQTPVGLGPAAFTTGDFNSDGRLDVATVNPSTNDLKVSLGVGDATLQTPVRLEVGTAPAVIVNGDFNRDGRLDLATANYDSGDVSVVLGLGDGTFGQQQRFAVGTNPVALVAGDFNGDGVPDLATANAGSKDLSILLNRGDGTFQAPIRLPAGNLPQALATGDFNGDGHADLACADYRSQDVAVFFGRGDGTFANPVRYALGTAPVSLAAGDYNEDGILDLATANYLSNDVSLLLGRPDGTFLSPVRFEAGTNPVSVVTSDFDGDGHADLATANSSSHDVSFLLGRGDGAFATAVPRPLGDYAVALIGADFTDDGRTDLAVATEFTPEVTLLQGLGDMTFVPGGTISNPIHAIPLVGDWTGDAVPDVAVVNRKGEILLRRGRPGPTGVFEAPVIVNPDPDPPARALTVVSTGQTFLVAALDAKSQSLSLYSRKPDGTFTRRAGPSVPGTLPVALATADLNGDGRDDLVVADAGANEVFVYLQNAAAGFGSAPAYRHSVGVSPSALDLVDVDGDGRLDIVTTNQFSGDVSVLCNDVRAPFATESRFRAGTGLYWLENHDESLIVRSRQGTAGLVGGNFDADSAGDLAVLNGGTNSFALLRGDGAGGLVNPDAAHTYATGLRPTVVVAGRFNDDPFLDLAILNEGSADVSIFLGDGHGGFRERASTDPQRPRLSAGYLPTGLAVQDVNGDGKLDLLVGNSFGDVLTLLGNGDGTFAPYQRAERNIALAVADLNGDGRDDFVFGNEGLDRVSVVYSAPGNHFEQDRQDGLLAPGAVQVADLNNDKNPDLVVANSGANDILVYLGLGDGQFAPAQSFFAGTNPTGITIQDLNSDRVSDLVVANEGSNDVSVLFGRGQGTDWTFTPGPRLRVGSAPVSTTVADVTGDGITDLLVSNSQANNVQLLPGVGSGFFNDQKPIVFDTGSSPRQAFVGNFDGRAGLDLVALNAGANGLTFFSNFLAPGAVGIELPSGGVNPVAAVAGDFNRDGVSDLLVAHQGNGVIALLLGHDDGLRVSGLRSASDIAHPTGLALADAAQDHVSIYVAGEGAETVARVSFVFDLGPIAVVTPPSRPPTQDTRVQVADLVPLEDATVAVVATLLTVRLEPELSAPQVIAGPDTGVDAFGFVGAASGFAAEPPADNLENRVEPASNIATLSPEQNTLFDFLTGMNEALASRPLPTREALLSPPRVSSADEPGPAALEEFMRQWLPGVSEQVLATGETLRMALRALAAPLSEPPQPRPDGAATPPMGASPSELPPAKEEPKESSDADAQRGLAFQSGPPSAPLATLVATLFAVAFLQAERTIRAEPEERSGFLRESSTRE